MLFDKGIISWKVSIYITYDSCIKIDVNKFKSEDIKLSNPIHLNTAQL